MKVVVEEHGRKSARADNLHFLFEALPNQPPIRGIAGEEAQDHAHLHEKPVLRLIRFQGRLKVLVHPEHEGKQSHLKGNQGNSDQRK